MTPTRAGAVETALAAAAARPDHDPDGTINATDTTDTGGRELDRALARLDEVEREVDALHAALAAERPPATDERPRTFAGGDEAPRTADRRFDTPGSDDPALLDRLRSLW